MIITDLSDSEKHMIVLSFLVAIKEVGDIQISMQLYAILVKLECEEQLNEHMAEINKMIIGRNKNAL